MKKLPRIVSVLIPAIVVVGCTVRSGGDHAITFAPPTQQIVSPTSTIASVISIGDGGLLSKEPCGPPCFLGIEPGKTTNAEASHALETEGILGECVSIDDDQSSASLGVGGWSCQSIFVIKYQKSSGIVDYIGFSLTEPVTLQDIVIEHGFPDFVNMLDTGLPEYPSFQISLYYSDLRIVFPLGREHKGAQFEIAPTTLIDSISYLDRQTLEYHYELFKEELFPWKGYGNYP